jgi:hypothetical protein
MSFQVRAIALLYKRVEVRRCDRCHDQRMRKLRLYIILENDEGEADPEHI